MRGARVRGSHQGVGSGSHDPVFGRRLMVVPEQVQQPVGEEERDLVGDRAVSLVRLAARRVERDDHVPQQVRVQVAALQGRVAALEFAMFAVPKM